MTPRRDKGPKARSPGAFLATVTVATLITACGLVLDLPDTTRLRSEEVDSDADSGADGGGDGAAKDGGDPGDGASGDGTAPRDGGTDGSDGGCTDDVLTSADHCGACGHSCLGGACAQGHCLPVVLASAEATPLAITTVGDHVFWANNGDNTLVRAAKTGSGRTVLARATDGVVDPWSLAVDDAFVYWSNNATSVGGSVLRCPLAGCGNQTPDVVAPVVWAPRGVAVTPTYVAWMAVNDDRLQRATKDGGASVDVAQFDGNNSNRNCMHLAVNGDMAFFSEPNAGAVRAASLAAVVPAEDAGLPPLFSGISTPCGVAATATHVVFTSWSAAAGTVSVATRSNIVGASSPQTLAVAQKGPFAAAADDRHAYWINEGSGGSSPDGSVVRCALAGCSGTPEVLADGLDQPHDLTLDHGAVYFVTAGDGKVWRLAK